MGENDMRLGIWVVDRWEIDGQMREWVYGKRDGWMDRWIDEKMRMNRWPYGWEEG